MMNKLKEVRFFRGLNQNQLSIQSGVDQSQISKLENNILLDTASTRQIKEKICKALDLKLEEVFPSES